MQETLNLKLPLLKQGQLNKDLTLNEALTLIDCILNSGLESLDKFSSPPQNLEDGKLILTGNNNSESFENFPNHIAFYKNGWRFLKPKEGLLLWVKSLKALHIFDGNRFIPVSSGSSGVSVGENGTSIVNEEIIKRLEKLETAMKLGEKNEILVHDGTKFAASKQISELSAIGIGTGAEIGNKLSVRSNSNLFASETGDVRMMLNKEKNTNTSSFIFQTNWKGRAEFGTIGGENFILKVSANGSNWFESFEVDATTGKINFKQDNLIPTYL